MGLFPKLKLGIYLCYKEIHFLRFLICQALSPIYFYFCKISSILLWRCLLEISVLLVPTVWVVVVLKSISLLPIWLSVKGPTTVGSKVLISLILRPTIYNPLGCFGKLGLYFLVLTIFKFSEFFCRPFL